VKFANALIAAALVSLAANTCTATTLGIAQDFNAFIFGNYGESHSDSEGPIAVGGNLTVSGFSLNAKHVNTTWSAVVGGNFTAQNGGSVYGNVIVGGTVSVPSYYLPNIQQAGPGNPLPVNFAAALITYQGLSSGLKQLPGTGPSYVYQGQQTFTGVDPDLNVFNMDGTNLSTLIINAPSTSTVIVNVSGVDIAWSNFGMALQGIDRTRVLFNFYEAQTITLTNIGVEGSVLAPNADLYLTNGGMNGNTIARSFNTYSTEPHWYPFAGNIPDSAWAVSTPEPGTFLLGGAALLLFRRFGQRRLQGR
jgi:choice-of-anchor A domain-containing protein